MLACVGATRDGALRQADDSASRVYRLGCTGVARSGAEMNLAGGWVVWITGWLPPGRVTSGEGLLVTLPSMAKASAHGRADGHDKRAGDGSRSYTSGEMFCTGRQTTRHNRTDTERG